jgi:hypothetical protein
VCVCVCVCVSACVCSLIRAHSTRSLHNTQVSAGLREKHPSASVWVSAQELSEQDLEAFVRNVTSSHIRKFLTGVVYGPHVRVPLTRFVAMLGPSVPVRQYPDICHTISCQFPVPAWHSAWVFTHGRQAINPMARMMANVVMRRSNGSTPTIGVGAYSEGLNDDLNKCVFSALGEDSRITVDDAVAQYARFFFGAEHEHLAVAGLTGLETAWAAGVAPNRTRTEETLAAWAQIATLTQSAAAPNWRLLMYLHRATYDALIAERFTAEQTRLTDALTALRTAARL